MLLLVGGLLSSMGTAYTDGDEPQYAAFYLPPDPLPPGKPGDLLRTELSKMHTYLNRVAEGTALLDAVNHFLPMLVDGEPSMQWIAARFNGEPTAANCGQF